MNPWYEELFCNYGETYDKEPFTAGTLQECEFIDRELGRDTSKRILDIGCGTGRHALELAKRGYQVTGADLSADQLKRAQQKAEESGVSVTFMRADARSLPYEGEFDAVLIICEGAFPLMETDRENFAILKQARKALAKGGKLILTTLNGLYPIHQWASHMNPDAGILAIGEDHRFDLMSFREYSRMEISDDDGRIRTLDCSERYYLPAEMTWMLSSLGFSSIEIMGCDIGAWERGVPLTPRHFEMLVVAQLASDSSSSMNA